MDSAQRLRGSLPDLMVWVTDILSCESVSWTHGLKLRQQRTTGTVSVEVTAMVWEYRSCCHHGSADLPDVHPHWDSD